MDFVKYAKFRLTREMVLFYRTFGFRTEIELLPSITHRIGQHKSPFIYSVPASENAFEFKTTNT